MSDGGGCACIIGLMFISFLVGSLVCLPLGERLGRDKANLNAVKAGVAEYYLDENNDKAFRYITPEQEPEND